MPVSSYPVTFTVKDVDNSTAKASVSCIVRNCTKKTTSAVSLTNSSGLAIVDLANLPLGLNQTNQYDTSDVLLLIAYHPASRTSDASRILVTGTSAAITLNLNYVDFAAMLKNGVRKIYTLIASNTAGAVGNVIGYSFTDAEYLFHINVPANDSKVVDFTSQGKQVNDTGFVLVRSAGTMICTANMR